MASELMGPPMRRPTDEAVAQTKANLEAFRAQRKEENAVTRAILGSMWGQQLDEHVARGIARWCRAHHIDPTEMDVLGGKPYLNAAYYLRRLSEHDPDAIEYQRADHVEHDPRLVTMMEMAIPENASPADREALEAQQVWARREHFRRQQERIAHGLSDDATAAVVYRVKRRGQDAEVVGADEVIKGRKKRVKKRDGSGYFEVDADPVGDANPRKTAETRAARRCLRQFVNAFPGLSAQVQEIEADAKATAEAIVEEARAQLAPPPDIKPLHTTGAYEEGENDPPLVVDQGKSEEDERRESPRTKAQLHNLQKVLEATVFTDEERAQAADHWVNATYGEMEDAIRNAKQIRDERLRAERKAVA